MDSSTDFTHLWHRHLANLRDDFSTGAHDGTSVRLVPSVGGRGDSEATPRGTDHHENLVGHKSDGDMDMVIDALQELEVQSPITATEALSPDSPWFRDIKSRRDIDGDGYMETETVVSSPQTSSWSRTVGPSKLQRDRMSLQLQPHPKSPVHLYTSAAVKGFDTDAIARAEKRRSHDWYRDHATLLSHSQQLYETYSAYPASPSLNAARSEPEIEPPAPRTRFSSIFSPSPRGRYAQLADEVNVLILSWATTTPNANFKQQGPIISRQGINTSTDPVRNCFKRLGYRVQCRLIPEDYPTAAVETILAKSLADSEMSKEKKKLLIVYYAGGAGMVGGRMMFANASGMSHFFWEDIREPIMSSDGDVLLIFDCHSLTGRTGEEDRMLVEPGLASSPSIKQLLGACVPLPGTESPNSNSKGATATQMTQALCRILDSSYVRGDGKVSVQRLCSFMKEELRQDGTGLEQRLFVTQLGGRHLLDIELPVLSVDGGNDVGGDMLQGIKVLQG